MKISEKIFYVFCIVVGLLIAFFGIRYKNFASAEMIGGANIYDDTKTYTDSAVLTLEDTNGIFHTMNSLLNGLSDSYNIDTGVLTQNVKVKVFSNGVGWQYTSLSDSLAQLQYMDNSNAWGSNLGLFSNLRCTIAKADLGGVAGNCRSYRATTLTALYLIVLKSDLSSLDNTGAVAWVTSHCPFTMMYVLSTPLSFNIKPLFNTYMYYQLGINTIQPARIDNVLYGVSTGGDGTFAVPVSINSVQNINIDYELTYPTVVSNNNFLTMLIDIFSAVGLVLTSNVEVFLLLILFGITLIVLVLGGR